MTGDYPYQTRMVAAVFDAWAGNERPTGITAANQVLLQAATGAGKTRMAGRVIERRLGAVAGSWGLFLCDRDELAGQAFKTFKGLIPQLPAGIVKATQNDYHRRIVIASRQTLAREHRRAPLLRRGRPAVIVVDEAHHAVLGGTYETILRQFGAFDGVPTLGLSATPVRADGKALGDVWQELVGRFTILDGIRGGYLTNVRGRRIRIKGLDLRGIKRTGGDLQAADLGERLQNVEAPQQVADAYLEYGEGRCGAFFWPTVASATAFAAACLERGVSCDVVTGGTPIHERAAMYERSRLAATNGTPHLLSNCMVLTEGFDAPWLSLIGMARMTESEGLYVQCVGRGVRTWVNPVTHAAKADCLLLDFTGVGARHRLAGFPALMMSQEEEPKRADLDADLFDELSLLQLGEEEEEKRAAAAEEEPAEIPGHIVVKEFDPFAGSQSSWQQTWGGVPFLEARADSPFPLQHRGAPVAASTFLLYITPDGYGMYSIMSCPVGAPGSARWTAGAVEQGMTYEAAMRHAELLAQQQDPSLASKKAPWRDAREPTDAQRRRFEASAPYGLGIPMPAGMTRGQASDMISVALASRTIHG